MMFRFLFVVALSTFAVNSYAGVSCAKLNRLWTQDYHRDFKINWEKTSFPCPSKLAKIAESFYYLERIQFKSSILKSTKPDFYNWVKKVSPGFNYQETTEKFPNMRVVASAAKGKRVTLYKVFAERKEIMANVATLIHETRHTQKSDPGHEKCLKGRSKGKRACDKKFYDGKFSGSGYNFAFTFYVWTRDASHNHDLSRKVADANLKYHLANRFNDISNSAVKKYTRKGF